MNRNLLATTALLALTSAAHAEGVLNIYAWSDSISPELITKFEAETGIKVTMVGFNSNENLLTKLQAASSGYDLVTQSQHFVKIMADSDLLQDIDAHAMAAYQAVDPKWRGQWWDATNEFSIPLAYGTA